MTALDIRNLSVRYGGTVALDDVSLTVAAGEIVALVGPSGSGKSTLAIAALGLLPPQAEVGGAVTVKGTDLATLGEDQLRDVRGGRVGIVFQEPATALNPALTIGSQIGEVLKRHTELPRAAIGARVKGLLADVGLELSPKRYPHSLSGGQRQRVAIAMAIAADPILLLADEPTASLDPLAQAGIIALLVGLVRARGMGLLLVTHDLGLARRIADIVVTLDGGRVVPRPAATVDAITARPIPRGSEPILTMHAVTRTYPGERGRVGALTDVSLTLAKGETLAVIGASGSGKSTLARLALGLDMPDSGVVTLAARDWRIARGKDLRGMRRRVQAVFQDPAASFDPRQTVGQIIAEPLHLLDGASAVERTALVIEALGQVGLPADAASRLPQAFSGGQRQRIALARALILRPDLVVLDEALSALDPALQAEMVALLRALQEQLGIAYLFIGHDMTVVRQVASRILVLRGGSIIEQGPAQDVLDRPVDPYTAALIASAE